MIKVGRWLGLFAAICLIAAAWGSAQAQTPEIEYFAQTGHNVQGDFLRYYRSAANPTLLFGYPITEQFTSKEGKLVQYFQRARFELRPDLPEGQRVQLTALGRGTYVPGKQLIINNPLACRTYPETGYSICYAFLEFFDQNGGLAQFGYPISPFEFQNNVIVQYFEKARFEWRPGQTEGQRVGLTDLGRVYFDKIGEDPAFLRPVSQGGSGMRPVLSLQVRAFPSKAVTMSIDQQTIYVLAQDQNLQPVSGAVGVAKIRYPNGEIKSQGFTVNERGVGILTFSFANQPNGQLVYIDIYISYNNLQGSTTTSFRIWY